MQLLDAHLHLQDARFDGLRGDILARARASGVGRFFCNATQESDWDRVLELGEAVEEVVPFVGIHPWFADQASGKWYVRLETLARDDCFIGETGLDRRSKVKMEIQEEVFAGHLELACRYNTPLVIHCVKAWGKLLEHLEAARCGFVNPPIMIHSFSGSLEIMERLLHLGAFISFSSALLNPQRSRLRQVFMEVPLDRLLLESDSPDQYWALPGQFFPDRLNEPAFIAPLYAQAADLLNMDLDLLTSTLWNNGSIYTNKTPAR